MTKPPPIPPLQKPKTANLTNLKREYISTNYLEQPHQMTPLPNLFTVKETRKLLENNLDPNKALGYDNLFTGKLLKALPWKRISKGQLPH